MRPWDASQIRISSRLDRWKDKSADIQARAGETLLIIPKRPDFVMVTGQVFNPTAVAYRTGKSVKWYLEQAGGVTTTAESERPIFVILRRWLDNRAKRRLVDRKLSWIGATGWGAR